MQRRQVVGLSTFTALMLFGARVALRFARMGESPEVLPEADPVSFVAAPMPPPPPVAFGVVWRTGTPAASAIEVPIETVGLDARLRMALSEGGARLVVAAGEAVEVLERDGDSYRSLVRAPFDEAVRDVGISRDGRWVFAHVDRALFALHEGPRGWSEAAPLPSSRAPTRLARSTRPIRVSVDGSVVAVGSVVFRRRGAAWSSATVEWSLGRLTIEALSRDGTRGVYCPVSDEIGSVAVYDLRGEPTVVARAIGPECVGALLEEDGRVRVSEWDPQDPVDGDRHLRGGGRAARGARAHRALLALRRVDARDLGSRALRHDGDLVVARAGPRGPRARGAARRPRALRGQPGRRGVGRLGARCGPRLRSVTSDQKLGGVSTWRPKSRSSIARSASPRGVG